MFARIVTFHVEPDKLADARTQLEQLGTDVTKEIKGLLEFISLARADGKVISITIFDSKSDMYRAVPKIMQIREQFADLLKSPPSIEEFEVLIHKRVKW